MPIVFGVALGGALGASARYGLDRLIEQRTSSVFPLGHVHDQRHGCFVIGLLTAALVERQHLPAWLRVGLVVGVVGGYTTFSTFAQETSSSARSTTSRSRSRTSLRACSSASPRSTRARSRDARCARGRRPCLRPASLRRQRLVGKVSDTLPCQGDADGQGLSRPRPPPKVSDTSPVSVRHATRRKGLHPVEGAADGQVFGGYDLARRCRTLLPVKVSDTLLAKVSNAVPQ